MLQVTVRNLERKCYMYSQNIYILFSLGVIPLDRHLVNQASFWQPISNEYTGKIQTISQKKNIKKIPPKCPE